MFRWLRDDSEMEVEEVEKVALEEERWPTATVEELEQSKRLAESETSDARKRMLQKICPHMDGKNCTSVCVHFIEGGEVLMPGTKWRPSRFRSQWPMCRLWK